MSSSLRSWLLALQIGGKLALCVLYFLLFVGGTVLYTLFAWGRFQITGVQSKPLFQIFFRLVS